MSAQQGLEIERELVLSTHHLPGPEYLDGTDTIRDSTRHGWLIYAKQHEESPPDPPEIHDALQLARDNGCQWIRFDQDGPVVDGIPVWDW